jgi:hypothetical protein
MLLLANTFKHFHVFWNFLSIIPNIAVHDILSNMTVRWHYDYDNWSKVICNTTATDRKKILIL